MDSANSTGSMQSSSTGGDEDSYDSRAVSSSISAFFNNLGPMPNPPPPQPPPHHHSSSSMFEYPFSNYLDPNVSLLTTNPNSLLNFDMVWSKNLRSEPNCTDLGGVFMASSSSQSRTTTTATFPAMNSHLFPPPGADTSFSGSNINSNNSNNMVRNPKKRSRASRRAPTAVMTTDTTNFRAMVQEFTGIPAPPFTSTSPFPRTTSLDLFAGMPFSFMRSSTATTNHNLDPSPPPPSYLLKPFAQNIQAQPQPLHGSSMADAIASTATTTATDITSGSASNGNIINSNSTSINYQLLSGPPPHHHHRHHNHQNMLNMNLQLQNPIFNLQPLLQAPTKPTAESSLDNIPSNHDLKIGGLEELGLSSHGGGGGGGHLSEIQSKVSSSSPSLDVVGTSSMAIMRNNHTNTNKFLAAAAAASSSSSISVFIGDHKVLQENMDSSKRTRTEGMVESWI